MSASFSTPSADAPAEPDNLISNVYVEADEISRACPAKPDAVAVVLHVPAFAIAPAVAAPNGATGN